MNNNTVNSDRTMRRNGPVDGGSEPPSSDDGAQTEERKPGDWLGQVDRYRLVEKLGQGAFGAVYRARDTVAEIDVALKALPPLITHNADEFEQVRSNFQLVQKLSHTNIAGMRVLHRADKVDSAAGERLKIGKGDYLVVMEYVPGSTLSSWRRQFPDGKVPPGQAAEVCAQIAAALDYAHSERIIHRDIKPGNVMVTTKADDRFVCKVLDFGLAAEIRSSMSRVSQQQGDTSGTRPYMAPEQWSGSKQGPSTDQYSLAVLYHELVSGAVPFASAFETNDPLVMMNVAENKLPPPLDNLSKKQNRALSIALAKDPAERYASCSDFVAALGGLATKRHKGHKKGGFAKAAVWLLLLGLLAAGAYYGTIHSSTPPSTSSAAVPEPAATPQSVTPGSAPADVPAGELACTLSVKPPGASLTLSRGGHLVREVQALPEGGLDIDLDPGTYTVQLSKPGYRPLSQNVTFGADKTEWSAELTELLGDLHISSDPGVTVTAKSESGEVFDLGTTDRSGKRAISTLREGHYIISMSRENYAQEQQTVEIISGKPAVVDQTLTGLPGSVRVTSGRVAEVWENGKKIGGTNETIKPLASGRHTLELRRRGFRTERLTVKIPPNGFKPVTAPALVPEAGSLLITANVQGPTSEQAAPYLKQTKVKIGDGYWKTVTLPYTEEGLSVGRHEARIEAPGFSVQGGTGSRERSPSKTVTVTDGKTASADFALVPEDGFATITCNAKNAEVFDANGTKLGNAGERLSLAPFIEHRLTVKDPKHQSATETVRIPQPGENVGTVRVTLEEIGGPVPAGRDWTSPATGMEFVWVPKLKCWVGKYEVTNEEYRKKERGHNSKESEGHSLNRDRQPVVYVNFDDAKAYAKWLTGKDRAVLGGARYRLPTEDEFMTYAQCGDGRKYPWGDNWPPKSGQAGNYAGEETKQPLDFNVIKGYRDGHIVTCDVEKSWENPWGLYGVGGNVWEACASNTAADQSWSGWRGASWSISYRGNLRCSYRSFLGASGRRYYFGFRVVLSR